jgi:uncharacterized membrane protein
MLRDKRIYPEIYAFVFFVVGFAAVYSGVEHVSRRDAVFKRFLELQGALRINKTFKTYLIYKRIRVLLCSGRADI